MTLWIDTWARYTLDVRLFHWNLNMHYRMKQRLQCHQQNPAHKRQTINPRALMMQRINSAWENSPELSGTDIENQLLLRAILQLQHPRPIEKSLKVTQTGMFWSRYIGSIAWGWESHAQGEFFKRKVRIPKRKFIYRLLIRLRAW